MLTIKRKRMCYTMFNVVYNVCLYTMCYFNVNNKKETHVLFVFNVVCSITKCSMICSRSYSFNGIGLYVLVCCWPISHTLFVVA